MSSAILCVFKPVQLFGYRVPYWVIYFDSVAILHHEFVASFVSLGEAFDPLWLHELFLHLLGSWPVRSMHELIEHSLSVHFLESCFELWILFFPNFGSFLRPLPRKFLFLRSVALLGSQFDFVVVFHASFRIFKTIIGLWYPLEVFLIGAFVDIRMIFFGQFAITLLELLIGTCRLNLKQLVVRFICIIDLLLLTPLCWRSWE